MEEWQEVMSAPITPEEMEWKVQTKTLKNGKCKALYVCYFTRATAISRLNNAFGLQWSDSYYDGTFNHKKEYGNGEELVTFTNCTIDVIISDHNKISRSGRATSADVEPSKSSESNAFKRAVSKFGMGLELYKYPKVYIEFTGKGDNKSSYYAPKNSVLLPAYEMIYNLVQSGNYNEEYFITANGELCTYEYGWKGKSLTAVNKSKPKPVDPAKKPFTAAIQQEENKGPKLLALPPYSDAPRSKRAQFIRKWDGKIHRSKCDTFYFAKAGDDFYKVNKADYEALSVHTKYVK
jgi:hypothetical protein